MAAMTIRLAPDLKVRLERLAETTRRSKSFLAAEAIRNFVDLNDWQADEVRKAVAEADREDFASAERVDEVFETWGVRAG
ncbi:MAG: CopG family transcriptional regulator [Gammaproteobacteria bacterium]|nr:CopG family transcriptional regulator [Gammaproteobacteria bacterium]